MFLNYFSLAILIVALLGVFYTFIYIHDLPYETAKARNHPHTEVIHVACWLSLFTLHAIWPIVYIWAVSKPKPGVAALTNGLSEKVAQRLSQLEGRLWQLEKNESHAAGKRGKS